MNRDELRVMRDYMASRGPDGKGEWFSENGRVGFAHRRLSIIDLSDRAAQPMLSADRTLAIVFNGEIYNYQQLREGLRKLGRTFRTDSDTEVLLQLYEEKGHAMVDDLRGMFAFAIWDSTKAALFLARDPYGIKPLYYSDDCRTLRFASQVKALLTCPRVSRQPEPAGIAGFYLFGSIPEPYTLYSKIRSVPAGSHLSVPESGPRPTVQYFSLANAWAGVAPGRRVSAGEVRDEVGRVLLDSVRHHLVSDVPVGAFLSAGIDSGTLVGLMKDAGQREIHTVTLAFEEFQGTADDESVMAASVAALHGVRHTIRVVSESEFRADLPRILAAMDQPSIDGVNSWFVSKAAREAGLKVAISGVGGDELFGGYPLFREIPRQVRLLWLPSRIPGAARLAEQVQAAFAPLFPSIHPKAAGVLRHGRDYPGGWLLRRGLFLPSELPPIVGAELAREGLARLQPLRHMADTLSVSRGGRRPLGRLSPFGQVATLDAALYLRNTLLRDTDWASMAHSLEVRTPLVDRVVLETLGPLLQAAGGMDRKRVFASVPSTPLPPGLLGRSKTGFSTPVSTWQCRLPELGGLLPNQRRAKREPWARSWSRVVMRPERTAE